MSNDGDELSDEDMFSPKKTKRNQTATTQPVAVAPGCKEQYIAKYKKLLNGIPPPPDQTNPDYHLDKLLGLWKDNQALLWEGGNGTSSKEKEEECPLGLCLNVDRSCEEFELLGGQVCERYIWSETAAVTSTAYLKLTQSAKKRRKTNGWGLSPRTRISYLTRRMTTFQKDNIASAVAANKTTQILVARSEPGKKVSGKGNGLKGKRALFLSPEHDNKFQTPETGKNKRLIRRLTLNSSPVRAESERILRNSESAKSSEKKKCSRSLFAATSEPTNSNQPPQQQPQKRPEQQQQIGGLSTQHRQKMLWAVSNALKAVKIRMTDPEFKMYASRLFKATMEKWQTTSGPVSGDRKTSTSDAMLVAAKSLVEEITGRKMSPKSAKKTAPKSQRIRTPEKTDPRDENSPPTVSTPDSLLSEASLNENGVFPLERVRILAEKLDPGGNVSNMGSFTTPKKSSDRIPFVDEPVDVDFDPNALSTRKRKRQETERLPPMDTEIMVSQRLRSRTPRKATAGFSSGPSVSCQSADASGLSRTQDDQEDRLPTVSPTVKRQKLESVTPVKSVTNGTPVRQSPRLLSSRSPMKSVTVRATPSKTLALTTIDETPSKSSADRRTPSKSTHSECGTPSKVLNSDCTPSKIRTGVNATSLKLLSDLGTPSKPPKVKHTRGIFTPTMKKRTPLKLSSVCTSRPDSTSDGANFDHLTTKKCVTFEDANDKPSLLLPEAHEDVGKPPVLRPEVLQRRSVRCFSAELPPPKLTRETSPTLYTTCESSENGHISDDNRKAHQTPVTRRRASTPTSGRRSPAGTSGTPGVGSGRKKVSLSLAGARKSKTPEDGEKPGNDLTLTPRRSTRRAAEVISSPN